MSAHHADIELFRNEEREFSSQCVTQSGIAIDITSAVFSSSAKIQAGDGAIIASATFTKTFPLQGMYTFVWDGADFDSYGNPNSQNKFSYDLKIDGTVVLYGQIILNPGVTP